MEGVVEAVSSFASLAVGEEEEEAEEEASPPPPPPPPLLPSATHCCRWRLSALTSFRFSAISSRRFSSCRRWRSSRESSGHIACRGSGAIRMKPDGGSDVCQK